MSSQKLTEEQKKLVEDNQRAIKSIANRYSRENKGKLKSKKITYDDIVQIAQMRACIVSSNYKGMNGAKFSTYLFDFLYKEINRDVNGFNPMKIPRMEYWTSDYNKKYRDEYSLIHSEGIGELDLPINIFEDSGGISEEPLVEGVKGSDFTDDFECLWIKNLLKDNLSSDMIEIMKMYIEGYLPYEISQILGIKRTTLVNRLYRARTKLKKIIEEQGLLEIGSY